ARGGHDEHERECARVRAALANAIAADGAAGGAGRGGRARRAALPEPAGEVADYSMYRQRYLSLQHTMETAIAALRGRLRGALAAGTPGMARLAALDAVMERALGARERGLLAGVPALLETRFDRLRRAAAQDAGTEGDAAGDPPPGSWLAVFRKDMQRVLLAELDIRLQPVEGLLAALRAA
ncbi:DUF3348 family protein, partial [Pigmentiphaga soli]|uniref:DUF3348 family protein n=1 Tax=Pigmentiphaga soli TaxID=1007095 RepID=UPI0031EB21DD